MNNIEMMLKKRGEFNARERIIGIVEFIMIPMDDSNGCQQ